MTLNRSLIGILVAKRRLIGVNRVVDPEVDVRRTRKHLTADQRRVRPLLPLTLVRRNGRLLTLVALDRRRVPSLATVGRLRPLRNWIVRIGWHWWRHSIAHTRHL